EGVKTLFGYEMGAEGVKTLFGYEMGAGRVNATWWQDRLHLEDKARIVAGVSAFIEGEAEFWSDEYRYRRADGSFAAVIDRAFILRDGGGNAVRMIGSMM